ncbi:hypothetical protein BIV24_17415 [Streptomyces colonosanans]|uniref:Uncharacterized protein n=1 Tax=Streptomyces colonosanans TaxID=1428652 RepID=A0A1S2PBH3_9ACTN|nr:hypothetical protein BIV24_17415 [Streptomyces colonosanans]
MRSRFDARCGVTARQLQFEPGGEFADHGFGKPGGTLAEPGDDVRCAVVVEHVELGEQPQQGPDREEQVPQQQDVGRQEPGAGRVMDAQQNSQPAVQAPGGAVLQAMVMRVVADRGLQRRCYLGCVNVGEAALLAAPQVPAGRWEQDELPVPCWHQRGRRLRSRLGPNPRRLRVQQLQAPFRVREVQLLPMSVRPFQVEGMAAGPQHRGLLGAQPTRAGLAQVKDATADPAWAAFGYSRRQPLHPTHILP